MQPILVLYATREGQAGRIAEHIGSALRSRGLTADIVNAAQLAPDFSLNAYSMAMVTASVHFGQHEKEIVQFVKRHVPDLEKMPTAFISVSMSEAGAEDSQATPEQRVKARTDVEHVIEQFLKNTGWHPSKIKAVAGALMYSEYNFVLRFVMKQIAKAGGASTDTSRNHEYTDWIALDRFLEEFTGVPAKA